MSCYNCYSARKIDENVIDKVLEEGQRLRSAMVQTILSNDPFNTDLIDSQRNSAKKSVKLDDISEETDHKIRQFLKGDEMSKRDEISVLETLRSMSARDLCKTTNRTYRSNGSCECSTCAEYGVKDLNCDLKRSNNNNRQPLDSSSNKITQKIQDSYRSQVLNFLRFVDSLKISVNSLILNEAGLKKICESFVCDNKRDKVASLSQTFFLEYDISDKIFSKSQKSKSKVDSGLDSDNVVRMCARRNLQQVVNFKQTSIHDISNISEADFNEITIKFNVSFRNYKQKRSVFLGCAIFEFNSFEVSKDFTCLQDLVVNLKATTPINLGVLRVSLQLGCGRLYFGKEFTEAIRNNKENSAAPTDEWSDSSSNFEFELVSNPVRELANFAKKPVTKSSQSSLVNKQRIDQPKKQQKENLETIKPPKSSHQIQNSIIDKDREILFGFVYVSEALFSRELLNSFIKCQLFAQNEFSSSKSVAFDSNPVYNFRQQIPLVYKEEFLFKLRENFMIIEFYEKGLPKDFLIGHSKLNLHQFYLAYRNPVVVKYLSEKICPVIGIDGWESVLNNNDEVIGQVQVLLALGTREQIENLEIDRGFKNNIVKAKLTPPLRHKKDKIVPERDLHSTVDVGVQSIMDLNSPNKESSNQNIEQLLNQLVAQNSTNKNVCVDNGTNTENNVVEAEINQQPVDVKNTSELLDSLQKALAFDGSRKEKNSFRVQIAIVSALHLPFRKKCKARKSKGRSGKHEDILPSTYVTFETSKEDLKITSIVPKSTSPKWDYRCEVALPTEYLTDSQKFLVFKVWRKSTNTTMTPNMQTDVVIGFATVDLTVLTAGLPNIQGWFNINDLSKKCNGQINIHVTPLEDIAHFKYADSCCQEAVAGSQRLQMETAVLDEVVDEPSELLGRALKRKFTELDEITQRLRLRLSKVTNDESDTSNDEIADEFERDINSLCIEEDYDMINFDSEHGSSSLNRNKNAALVQTEEENASGGSLVDSKQKIDALLEKLSLISAENSSRYVSGCSETQLDTEAILNELDHNSRPNLYSVGMFDKHMNLKFASSLPSGGSDTTEEGRGEASDETVVNK